MPGSIDEILNLYKNEGWNEYIKDEDGLIQGMEKSLCVVCAYSNNELVGFIRCIGDGNTILLIQDLIINDKYKNNGIGRHLIQYVCDKYNRVRQKILICDDEIDLTVFYEKCGFKSIEKMNMKCYIKG